MRDYYRYWKIAQLYKKQNNISYAWDLLLYLSTIVIMSYITPEPWKWMVTVGIEVLIGVVMDISTGRKIDAHSWRVKNGK